LSISVPGHSFPKMLITVMAESTLREVIRRWASDHLGLPMNEPLPTEVRVTAGGIDAAPLQNPLDLNVPLQQIRHLLPVLESRLAIAVMWPGAELKEVSGRMVAKSAKLGVSKLFGLVISTRYADVDRGNVNWHQSSNMNSKVAAGVYDWHGKYSQKFYQEAMRTPSIPDVCDLTLASRTLCCFGQESNEPTFCALLTGPENLVQNWEATCEYFQKKLHPAGEPFACPVFIPTRSRCEKAHLNYEADHVFGKIIKKGGKGSNGRVPVVCAVVEPHQEEEYRNMWPFILTLVLPESGRGPGFARWAIQQVCGHAWVKYGSRWRPRRLPFAWLVDDSISMFYKMTALADGGKAMQREKLRSGLYVEGKSRQIKQREAPEGAPMFHDAMVAMQRHSFMPRSAVSGFLREDGTAVCKKLEWKSDEMALYKIVLLNVRVLKRLRVEYQKDIKMYEDICLTHQVLREGGHTLKCQGYAFCAAHSKSGGAAASRLDKKQGKASESRGKEGLSGTLMKDIISPLALGRLEKSQQEAVAEILSWVRKRERSSKEKGEEKERKVLSLSITEACATAASRAAARRAKRDYKYESRKRRKKQREEDRAKRKVMRAMGLPSPPRRKRRRGKITEEEAELSKRYSDLKISLQKALKKEDESLVTTIRGDMEKLRREIRQASQLARKKYRDEIRAECKEDDGESEFSTSSSSSSSQSSRKSARKSAAKSRSRSGDEVASEDGESSEEQLPSSTRGSEDGDDDDRAGSRNSGAGSRT